MSGRVAWRAAATGIATFCTLLISVPGQASAAPNCSFTHGLEKVADNDGGYWRVELLMNCNDISGVLGIEWKYAFWAEPQGGGPATAYFTSGGTPSAESRTTEGRYSLVQVGAPLGHSRYCYSGVAITSGPKVGEGQDPSYFTGTHCVDA